VAASGLGAIAVAVLASPELRSIFELLGERLRELLGG
jgi:hypothetical protein